LQTLNEELNTRNLEMAQINNDLSNLLSSINLPIVMVDNALAVRRTTPLAEKLFNLIPTDIGRRLTDIKPNLQIDHLDQMIRKVIDTLETHEREVTDDNNVSYILRIRPYRTRDHKIDGAVLTLMDIDPVKRSRTVLETAMSAVEAASQAAGTAALVLDFAFRMQAATSGFRERFRLREAKLDGVPIFELDGGAWNLPGLREYLRKAAAAPAGRSGRVLEKSFAIYGRPVVLRASLLSCGVDQLIILNVREAPRGRK